MINNTSHFTKLFDCQNFRMVGGKLRLCWNFSGPAVEAAPFGMYWSDMRLRHTPISRVYWQCPM